MTKLRIDYPGFKLAYRIGDKLALSLDAKKKEDVAVLHKMKNLANIYEGMRRYKAFSVNGQTYAQ